VDQTVLVFDADEAGRRAAARALPLFMTADMDAVVLRLPEGHDPDTFVREYGPRAFEEAAAGAVPLLDFYLDVLRRKHPDSLAGRSRMVQDALEVMGQVESPVRRELLRKAMADRLGVSEDALSRSLRRPVYQEDDPEPRERTEEHAAHFEQDLVRTLLLHPEAAAQVFSHDLGPLFQDTRLKTVYEALSEGYRIHGIVATDRMEGLSPDQTDMVTRLAMGEDGLTEDTLAPAVQDAVERFFEREKRSRVVDLSRRIKEAQAAGDDALLFNLMKEKNRLLKSARLGTRGTPREELPDGHWQ
jgi:DNA primase